MATIVETLADMTDGGVLVGTGLDFRVFDKDPTTGAALPANLPSRLFVRAHVPLTRSDGKPGGIRTGEWFLFSSTVILGMQSGDAATARPILKRAYDWLRDLLA